MKIFFNIFFAIQIIKSLKHDTCIGAMYYLTKFVLCISFIIIYNYNYYNFINTYVTREFQV